MPRKRYTPEQIIGKLREAEILMAKGLNAAELSRVAKTYIKPNNYNIVVVGNESVLDKIKALI